MWPFGKRTVREKEIRRSKAERRSPWYARLGDDPRTQPLLLLAMCALAAAAVVNQGRDRLALAVGQRISRAITARVAFGIVDDAQTRAMRMRARDNAEDYFALDVSLVTDIRGKLSSAFLVARQHTGDAAKIREDTAVIKVQLDDAGLDELVRLASAPDSNVFEQAVDRAVGVLRRQPLVEAAEQAPRRTGINAVLVDRDQSTERKIPITRLLFASSPEDVGKVADAAADEFPVALRPSIRASIVEMLRADGKDSFRPLYRYDQAASAEAAQAAAAAVPTQYREFAADSRLADPGEISPDELALLREEHAHYQTLLDTDPVLSRAEWQAAIARGLMALLVVFGLGAYIVLRARDAVGRPRAQFATAVALLLALALSRVIYLYTPLPYLAVGMQAVAVALLAITSGRVPAQAAGALLALVITLATRQSIGFLVVLVGVSVVLFFGLRDVRHRGRIIAIGALAAVVALFATLLIGIADQQSLRFLFWNRGLWAALTTLGAAFIVEGILPGIERLFGVTTNMTLLEWCDPSKPLLRMLAGESPGTYNHSFLVGALAGPAADAIEANGLLARAGAYYHDIGKINKPEYFIENQGTGVANRHARLSPAMSHLIIIGHVKDGIEMAKAYGLPITLHAFIPEHHGTCIIEYFYHAATQARRPGDPEVRDTEFRYPGPKPQSRETAIVMLCDGVEGAVRAMAEPTPGRIEDTVARMIQKRLADGQFDECDLTFRELAIIRQSLVKSLISIYHGRISYPGDNDQPETPNAPA